MPELLQVFLQDLELTRHSMDVWRLIVRLGRQVNLPFVDFVSASSFDDANQSLFVRTSYDSTWLHAQNSDRESELWSYFRDHAMKCLTPVMVGIEFVDEYRHVPRQRVDALKLAAERGIRSGFSIPLRQNAPPRAASITFSGGHSRREMQAIVRAHGWVLHTAALMGHERYLSHFNQEFRERNNVTDKQMQLLALIGSGLQDKAIADRLGVSISAVRQRMKVLMKNTMANSRTELAALAMSLGILPDPFDRPAPGKDENRVETDHIGARVRQNGSISSR